MQVSNALYGKNSLNRKQRNHSTSIDFNTFLPFYFDVIIYIHFVMNPGISLQHGRVAQVHATLSSVNYIYMYRTTKIPSFMIYK